MAVDEQAIQRKDALSRAVIECFSAILSGDQEQRKDAECELKALEVTEDYGVVLAEITLTSDGPVAYRQLASLVLKQYVKSHWIDEDNADSMPNEETKVTIRELLLKGLGDPVSKIRAAVAYAVSAIGQCDWPEKWPDLFDQLMLGLSSGIPDLVHGTMRVLCEFCEEVSDHQISHIAPLILPHLLNVISSNQLYSVHTRSRAISIFRTISQLIYSMSALIPDAVTNLLFPFLPTYIDHFIQVLSSKRDDFSDDSGLIFKEIILTLSNLVTSFPALLRPHLLTIVTPVWNVLVSSTRFYLSHIVNSYDPAVDSYDSDGEVINFDSILMAVFGFISTLLTYGRQSRLFRPILFDLVNHLMSLMQITAEQVVTWETDVSNYIEHDDGELTFSVRLGALELLLQLADEKSLRSSISEAVCTSVDKRLTQSSNDSEPANRWKIREVCMLVVGSLLIDEGLQSPVFNGQIFVDNVLLPNATSSDSPPILVGRCLWLAGKMSDQVNLVTLDRCLQAVVSGLQSSQHLIIRTMAAKSCFYLCQQLKSTDRLSALVPYLTYFINGLCDIASDSNDDIIFIVLDSLQLVCQMNQSVTAAHSGRLIPLSLALFFKFCHDPAVSSCLEDLFQSIADNPGCQPLLHSRFIPTAIELMSVNPNQTQVPSGMISSILDVLVIILRGCSSPLPASFINQLFVVVVHQILSSDDSAILQSGGECIRAFISMGANQLIEWYDDMGQSGLHYITKVVVHLLDPSRPEYSAALIDKLIIVFLKKVGNNLGTCLELLLRSVLSKMQQSQTSSVMQSLLIVFAHLASNQQLEGLLSFLCQVPDPTGKSALEYVITEWCTRHSFFYGHYQQRISTIALCQLLSHCVATGDHRLNNILVMEEEIASVNDGIVTRSKRCLSEQKFIQVPLPVKLLKVLIGDLRSQLENEDQQDDDDDDNYDEDNPWEDGGTGEEVGMVDCLEMLLSNNKSNAFGAGYDFDDVCDDPDLKDEELLKINLQTHLVQYLTEFSQQPCFPSLFLHLSQYEKETLNAVGAIPLTH